MNHRSGRASRKSFRPIHFLLLSFRICLRLAGCFSMAIGASLLDMIRWFSGEIRDKNQITLYISQIAILNYYIYIMLNISILKTSRKLTQ